MNQFLAQLRLSCYISPLLPLLLAPIIALAQHDGSTSKPRGLRQLFHREIMCVWRPSPLSDLYASLEDTSQYQTRDSDADGVLDILDREPGTDTLAAVNAQGVALDSDGDQCPDHMDPQPNSSPVLPMENCVNVRPACILEVEGRLSDGENVHLNSTWCLPYIFFDLGKADIRPDAVTSLNLIADLMHRYGTISIEVIGYSDTLASEECNKNLPEDRARNAIEYLTSKGVPEHNLEIIFKDSDMIKIGGDEFEHQLNRRVEFHIVSTNK